MADEIAPNILEAATWLATQEDSIPHAVPLLKERFHLTGLQACQAIALARNGPADDPQSMEGGDS